MSTTMPYQPKVDEIKALREETSAPMMDCRRALVDAGGDSAKAKALLLERGAAQAAKKSERVANEGTVASYVHAGGKIADAIIEGRTESESAYDESAYGPEAEEYAQNGSATMAEAEI